MAKGVINQFFNGYPESPSNHPPSGNDVIRVGSPELDKTKASWEDPGKHALRCRNLLIKLINIHVRTICNFMI